VFNLYVFTSLMSDDQTHSHYFHPVNVVALLYRRFPFNYSYLTCQFAYKEANIKAPV